MNHHFGYFDFVMILWAGTASMCALVFYLLWNSAAEGLASTKEALKWAKGEYDQEVEETYRGRLNSESDPCPDCGSTKGRCSVTLDPII